MQQRRGASCGAIRRRNSIAELVKDASHQMKRAETVSESRVLGPLIGVETKAKLFDATQPLKFGRVDQSNHQLALGVVVTQRNDIVDGIAVDSLRHFFRPCAQLELKSITAICFEFSLPK
jgi:hypothetical protein